MAERGPIRGTSLYLVLKSNGLLYPKIQLKKFEFSSKSVPANIAKKLPPQCCYKPFFIPIFKFSHKRPTFAFTGESGYTLGFANRIAHSGLHAETGGVSDGVVSLLSERSARSPTSPGRVSERQVLPLLGLGWGCSQRTQKAFGTAMRMMRVAVPRRRGPAGLRGLFSFLSKLRFVCPALRVFPRVRGEGWYHYPQRALRAAETPDGRLSKRLICRFLRSGGRSSPHDSYFLANTQNFLLAVPVANAFALWYDKFDKLELSN